MLDDYFLDLIEKSGFNGGDFIQFISSFRSICDIHKNFVDSLLPYYENANTEAKFSLTEIYNFRMEIISEVSNLRPSLAIYQPYLGAFSAISTLFSNLPNNNKIKQIINENENNEKLNGQSFQVRYSYK